MAKDDKEADTDADGDLTTSPIIKKISSLIIMGEKISAKLIPEKKTESDLYQIAGIATDTKTGESNYGGWTAFLGEFRAVNCFTGEVFTSAKAFLPDVLGEMLMGKLAGQGENGRGIAFAFVVGIRRDEKSTVGYTYYAKPVQAPKADDPMAELVKSLPKVRVKALTHKAAK
jgi:hypothetical protein